MRAEATVLCLLLPGLAGCVGVLTRPEDPEPGPSAAEASVSSNGVRHAEASSDVAVTSRESRETVHRSIWSDPAFQRRFAESYLAETDIEPGVDLDERDVMLEVLDLISADRLEEAALLVQRNRGESANAVFDFTLGNIHYQKDELDQAAAALEIAVQKHPKYRRAWQALAEIHFRQGDFEKAVDAFAQVITTGGGDAITYGLLGLSHARLEDFVSAESAFEKAIMLDPRTIEWKVGLADSFFRQGRYAEAAALFERLIAEQPDRHELWLEQGKAYAMMDEPLKAAQNFEMVDRLGGSTADSLFNLGNIYANERLFDVAVDTYLRALEKEPAASAQRAVQGAHFLVGNGAFDDARRLLEGIEELRGASLDVDTEQKKELLRLHASIALAEGAGDEEARILKQIVDLDPLDGRALILLGRHSQRSGDIEQAVFYFERGANIEAFEAEAKLRHGELLVKEGKLEDALPLLKRSQGLEPRDNVQTYIEQVERMARRR